MTKLLMTDDCTIVVPSHYIKTTTFFDGRESDIIATTYDLDDLRAAFNNELPSIERVEQVLHIHDTYKSDKWLAVALEFTNLCIKSETIQESSNIKLIRQCIHNPYVAAIIRCYGCIDIHNLPIDNKILWAKTDATLSQLVSMKDYLNVCRSSDCYISDDEVYRYINENWDNEELHRLAGLTDEISLCKDRVVKIYQAVSFNKGFDPINGIYIGYISGCYTYWSDTFFKNIVIKDVERLVHRAGNDIIIDMILQNILISDNIEQLRYIIRYCYTEGRELFIPTFHIFGSVRAIECIDTLLIDERIRMILHIAEITRNIDTYLTLNQYVRDNYNESHTWARNYNHNIVRYLIEHQYDNNGWDGVTYNKPYCHGRHIIRIIADLFIDNNIEALKSIPSRILYRYPEVRTKLDELLT